MTIAAQDVNIMLSLARMAGQAGLALGYLPLVGFMAGLARASAVFSPEVHSGYGVAGLAIDQRLGLLVRLVAVSAGILHRGIGGPGNPFFSQSLVTVKATLTQRDELVLFYQILMAGSAMHRRHPAYLHVFLLVANVTDRPRRLEAMQGKGMALGTGDVLLLSVYLVAGGSCYLSPLGITAFMAVFTGLVKDCGVPLDSVITVEGEIDNQLGAGQ
jgi:hypothetical protein